MNKSETIGALAAALAKAQAEIKTANKTSKNPHLGNMYADLASVWTACRLALSANELSVVQTFDSEPGRVTCNAILLHASGEWISSSLSCALPAESKQTIPQVMGSVITYLRRYTLQALVGVAADDDDDGNQGTKAGETEGRARGKAAAPAQTAPEGDAAEGIWPGPGPCPGCRAPANKRHGTGCPQL